MDFGKDVNNVPHARLYWMVRHMESKVCWPTRCKIAFEKEIKKSSIGGGFI